MTSWEAWKEQAACRGRLPRSLRRDASSMKIGCFVFELCVTMKKRVSSEREINMSALLQIIVRGDNSEVQFNYLASAQ